jgi:hypothetical protein
MSFFNKIQIAYLNFSQKVVTITTGLDIGINNILQIIESNFDDIRRLFDPSVAGGGISGQNIQDNTITSDKVKLSTIRAVQGSYIFNDINQNGQGAFSPRYTVCNTVINVTGTQNKDILLNSSMYHIVKNSAGNNLCNMQHHLQISKVSNFSSTVYAKLLTKKVMDNGNNVWTNDQTTITDIVNLPIGTYYIRSEVWGDGNTSCGFETRMSTLTVVQL